MEHLQQQTQRDRRTESLGDLHVLPDELICATLDSLTPRDIGRLACVSSVLYILCNEEPLWMNLCLRVSGMLEYKGSWKKTTLYRQNLSPNIAESCQKSLQFNGFNSMFLYKRWYRCFTTLDSFSVNNCYLERKKNLSLEEFYSVYDGRKPVLLTELANTWPARDSWTTDQLLLNYGDTSFRISQRSSKKITMKFKDYVSYMKRQHDEDPLYIFDDKFGEAAPSLLKDYSIPHLFREDFFDVLDNDQRPPYRWLIIGPERSGASWHVDPALTSAWNTLLSGRKRWALYPPGRVPLGVTVHVNEEDGDIHIEAPSSLQWWLDFYPLLADNDKPLECTQLPGETIFVPSGWWHCVLNLETTIAVTQNFVNTSNFEFACLDMAPGHLHKGVCRAGLLAVQDGNLNKNTFDKNRSNYTEMAQKEKRLRLSKPSNETHRYDSNESDGKWRSRVHTNLQDLSFSYDIDFLSAFLEEERDHYNSMWSSSNCIGQREMREWLHRLWALKPEKRELIWKGACIALNADKWLAYMVEICSSHNLLSPVDVERLPVGTGSNPVYFVADNVIKIYVEGGFESCIHSLGTELEFYSLLHRVRSPLIDHVPDILASGIVLLENGSYRTVSWDGKGVPDVISNCNLICGNCMEDSFSFGVWSKKLFEFRASASVSCTRMWPYLVTKRCKGDIFAHLRDLLQWDDMLTLASFLGDQLHNLHILPIPSLQIGTIPEINKVGLSERIFNGLEDDGCKKPMENAFKEHIQGLDIPTEWKLFVATIYRKRRDLSERLTQWGDPIPELLIEKVEQYIPRDLAMLLNIFKDKDGLYKTCGSPTWIHSDVMDDNIHMEQYLHLDCFHKNVPDAMLTANGRVIEYNEERQNRWSPTHILDFSDLSIGDPIYDLIPVYLDVFRGIPDLLRRFLESYRLPLARRPSDGPIESWKKIERLSYRAMCYCILHEENILGAIFSLWKDLRVAKSWEEVEEAVWGELNKYQCADFDDSKT